MSALYIFRTVRILYSSHFKIKSGLFLSKVFVLFPLCPNLLSMCDHNFCFRIFFFKQNSLVFHFKHKIVKDFLDWLNYTHFLNDFRTDHHTHSYFCFQNGYKDGIHDGKESMFQIGFDAGYKEGFKNSFNVGKVHGLTMAAGLETKHDLLLRKPTRGHCQICSDTTLLDKPISKIVAVQSSHSHNVNETLNKRYNDTI